MQALNIFCCGCVLIGMAAQATDTHGVVAVNNPCQPPAATPATQPAAKETKAVATPDSLTTGDPALDRILKQICDHNPGERERLLQLRQTDAAAFRAA